MGMGVLLWGSLEVPFQLEAAVTSLLKISGAQESFLKRIPWSFKICKCHTDYAPQKFDIYIYRYQTKMAI